MKNIAIITARGGSKRIPGKNIRDFNGQPMLAYPVKAALESGLFEEVMVSTDDPGIAETAKGLGAAVPFIRSESASDDHATTSQVLREVLETYGSKGRTFENACCLYPTAPFITAERLREAYRVFTGSGADTLLPVVAFSFPPQRGVFIREGRAVYVRPECREMRSQDLERIYHDCGQFYFFRTAAFLKTGILVGENTVPFEMDEKEVQDIDNPADWEMAELKYRLLHKDDRRTEETE